MKSSLMGSTVSTVGLPGEKRTSIWNTRACWLPEGVKGHVMSFVEGFSLGIVFDPSTR